jgi:carbamoyl-phosphate synthase large subunit
MRILFTGGGGAGSEALWKILNKKYTLFFADAVLDNIDKSIPADSRIEIAFANSKNYLESIKSVCDKNEIDLIVPSVDEELMQFDSFLNKDVTEVFLPNKDFVRIMLDKYTCAKAIKSTGLSGPKTFTVARASEIGFPLIVKPKTGRGSRGVRIVNSLKELNAYKILYPTNEEDLIVQELAIGTEYTVLVSANKKGQLNAIIPVKVDQKIGITIQAKIDMNNLIIEYAKKFHSHYRTSGIYNIQCILTQSGVVYPFEINPRISTTFCLSVAAGFDPFELYFNETSEEKIFTPSNELSLQRNWVNNIY